jgi:hypothetical protein
MKEDEAIFEAVKIVLQHKQMNDSFNSHTKLSTLVGTVEMIEKVANDLMKIKIK